MVGKLIDLSVRSQAVRCRTSNKVRRRADCSSLQSGHFRARLLSVEISGKLPCR